MLSSYAHEVLTQGGQIVHETVEGSVHMSLVNNQGETVLARVFAEAAYLLSQGLAVVSSVAHASSNSEYHRVIVAS
jgi:hypothetical protein